MRRNRRRLHALAGSGRLRRSPCLARSALWWRVDFDKRLASRHEFAWPALRGGRRCPCKWLGMSTFPRRRPGVWMPPGRCGRGRSRKPNPGTFRAGQAASGGGDAAALAGRAWRRQRRGTGPALAIRKEADDWWRGKSSAHGLLLPGRAAGCGVARSRRWSIWNTNLPARRLVSGRSVQMPWSQGIATTGILGKADVGRRATSRRAVLPNGWVLQQRRACNAGGACLSLLSGGTRRRVKNASHPSICCLILIFRPAHRRQARERGQVVCQTAFKILFAAPRATCTSAKLEG